MMTQNVKALILAAGEGTRLRPLTLDRPKPMVLIGGRPLLEHTVALLCQHGVRNIAINLSYKPEVITSHFSRMWGVNLVYSYEDPILGTAGAARKLAWFLDSTFILVYGDVLTDIDFSTLLAYHRSQAGQMTIVVYRVEDPTRCGIVEVEAAGRVRSFVEKPDNPTSDLANAGIYAVEPSVLDLIPDGFADFGVDVIPRLPSLDRPVYAFLANKPNSYILDIGSLERYEQACRDAQEGRVRMLRLDDRQPADGGLPC